MTAKILIIEDDEDICELIHFHLFRQKYEVQIAYDGEKGVEMAKTQVPDLVITDIMMPKKDGIEVCKELKNYKTTKEIPIIIVTAKGHDQDMIAGFEAGADDYITKPFSAKVLTARVKAVLRRFTRKERLNFSKVLVKSGLTLNPNKNEVETSQGNIIKLTQSEFQILYLLVSKSGWVFNRSQILEIVKGSVVTTDRSIDVQVASIRKKLGYQLGMMIETIRNIGYRFRTFEEIETIEEN